MKIINLFKQELKTKWSSRLLMALGILVVASVFGSSFLLKREYDLLQKDEASTAFDGRFKGYKKLVNQPFTHIKTVGGSSWQLGVETGTEAAVFVKNSGQKWAKMAEKIFVRNDTLFVNLNKQGQHYSYSYPSRGPTITIMSPNIQSIDADNSYISVSAWFQRTMTVNLSNASTLETTWPIDSLDTCKISMTNYSKFTIQNYFRSHISSNDDKFVSDTRFSNPTIISTFEANLKDGCELSLGSANIQNFKLNTINGNKIELSSETLKGLMKK